VAVGYRLSALLGDLLSDLRVAVNSFGESTSRLDAALVQASVRPFIRVQVGDTASDIQDAVLLLEEAHPAAAAAQDEETHRLFEAMPIRLPPPESQTWTLEQLAAWQAEQPQPTNEQWQAAAGIMAGEITSGPYAKVRVGYKALLFFVRAYQDALYRAFLEARGEKAGKRSSMESALAGDKPLGVLMRECLPEYRDWFPRWRKKRNRVKDGVSIGFTGVNGFGLLFNSVSDEGGLVADLAQTPLSLSDVIEAVSMSAGAANCIAGYIEKL
jgi:hypothetical protein